MSNTLTLNDRINFALSRLATPNSSEFGHQVSDLLAECQLKLTQYQFIIDTSILPNKDLMRSIESFRPDLFKAIMEDKNKDYG